MVDQACLERVTVSSANPVPLYLQLSAALRTQITEGHLPSGASLPTVQSLARHCGMSQATVMRALTDLASEGLIVTRRGARSVVAARRAASTEVLVGNLSHSPTLRDVSFFNQLLNGLRQGYQDPDRRFLTTYMDANPVHGAELIRVCQVSQADGIVAYRPKDLAVTTLRDVARQIPVVSLFYPVPEAPADCVQADPVPGFRTLLKARIAAGKRRFWYVGALDYFLGEPGGYSPHARIYQTLAETLRGAGLELMEINLPDDESEGKAPRLGRDIPDDAVLVASHPRLAIALEGDRPRLDMIAYTEYRGSADLAAGRVTTLYLGLETVGLAAAELLKSRIRSGNSLPSRTVRLKPTVIPATGR